jgi:hypothetical protein
MEKMGICPISNYRMTYGVMPLAVRAQLLLALYSAFGNPQSALE